MGGAVGSADYVAVYLDHHITAWAKEVDRLSEVAATHPHAAYAAYIFGLRHCWTFLQLNMPTVGECMQHLKEAVDNRLIPTLMKYPLNDAEMDLVRLPARLGVMSCS